LASSGTGNRIVLLAQEKATLQKMSPLISESAWGGGALTRDEQAS
jgi:hypothetical protein